MHVIILIYGGAIAVALIIADACLAYSYGNSFGGELGSIYQVVFASSVLISPALPIAFAAAKGDPLRRLVVILLLLVCVACNVSTRYLAISWMQSNELRSAASLKASQDSFTSLENIRTARSIRHEIDILGKPNSKGEKARSILLANELDMAERRDGLREKLATHAQSGMLSGLGQLDGVLGYGLAFWSAIMSIIYIVASEAISSLGLYAMTKRAKAAPAVEVLAVRAPVAEAPALEDRKLEPAPTVVSKAPAQTIETVKDPVTEFITTQTVPHPGGSVPYDDIRERWEAWAGRNGVSSDGVNLGLMLKRHGYSAGATSGRNKKRTYRGLALAA